MNPVNNLTLPIFKIDFTNNLQYIPDLPNVFLHLY